MLKTPAHDVPWQKPTPRGLGTGAASTERHALPKQTDVVVVGGGISGLSCALMLAEGGKRVCVLEMGETLSAGDTGKSSAHVTMMLDEGYAQLRKNFGDEAMRDVARVHQEAVEQIARWSKLAPDHADFLEVPGYIYAASPEQDGTVNDELEAMRALGIEATGAAAPVPPAQGVGLRVPKQGQIDPRAYVEGLADALVARGGQVHTGLRMTGYTREDDGICVQTAQGDIHAAQLVLATHTPPTKLVLQTKMEPMRTYMVAAEVRDMPPPGQYYDTEEPYHYTRPHVHKGHSSLVVGGKDHRVGAVEDTASHLDAIEAYVREHYDVTAITHRWSGQIFEPADGLPYMGQLPGESQVWVITGLSGNGLTSGTVGARLCAESILGAPPAWAATFSPSRIKPIAMAAAFAKHNAETSLHLVGDRLKAMFTQHALQPGEGAVMREGAHAAAVYNDGEQVHTLSPVCPHAGCYVKWNNSERSWDCPCHGSRFSGTGTLLEGPATSDLSRLGD